MIEKLFHIGSVKVPSKHCKKISSQVERLGVGLCPLTHLISR